MCCRYQFSSPQNDELCMILRDAQRRCGREEPALEQASDILPSQTAPVMIARGSHIIGDLQIFGRPAPHRPSLILNARAETVTQKPMFARNIAAQRCVVPTSGFYEWDGAHQKYFFSLPGQDVLFLAGIYDNVDGQNRFMILTTEANATMQPVHDRMPLVLLRHQIRPWLTDPGFALRFLAEAPPLLERTACCGQMSMWDE